MSGAERERARWSLLVVVAVVVFAADQLSKWWAVETLDTRIIDLVGSLRFRLALNHGAAFSLSQGRGPLISVLALVVVGILLRTGRHATRPLAALALGMVVGGALGNLADRAFREGDGFLGGGVVDFIDLQWWPIFNVADMGVVCGAILLVLLSWREPEPASGDDPARDEPTGAGTGSGADGGGADAGAGERGNGTGNDASRADASADADSDLDVDAGAASGDDTGADSRPSRV